MMVIRLSSVFLYMDKAMHLAKKQYELLILIPFA